jgi:hypothetical protein
VKRGHALGMERTWGQSGLTEVCRARDALGLSPHGTAREILRPEPRAWRWLQVIEQSCWKSGFSKSQKVPCQGLTPRARTLWVEPRPSSFPCLGLS